MPAMIQGYRPDPRIRQPQLAELRRIYGDVVKQQQGAIVFRPAREGAGSRFVNSNEVPNVHPR